MISNRNADFCSPGCAVPVRTSFQSRKLTGCVGERVIRVFGFCRCDAHLHKAKSRFTRYRADALSKSVAYSNFEFSYPGLTAPAFLAFVVRGRRVASPTPLA